MAVVISSVRRVLFCVLDISYIPWLVCCFEACLDRVIGVAAMAVV